MIALDDKLKHVGSLSLYLSLTHTHYYLYYRSSLTSKMIDNMALQATTMVLLVEAIMDMVLQAIMRQEIMGK